MEGTFRYLSLVLDEEGRCAFNILLQIVSDLFELFHHLFEGAEGLLRPRFHLLDGALAKLDGALFLLDAFNAS